MSAVATAAPLLVYFSSVSGNTARFVEKLGLPARRIPLHRTDRRPRHRRALRADHPHLRRGRGARRRTGAVPKQVIRFLNDERNRRHIRGVISAGNTNFGESFCLAGDIISRKCQVPHLYRFEIFGTQDDVDRVSDGLERRWAAQLTSRQ